MMPRTTKASEFLPREICVHLLGCEFLAFDGLCWPATRHEVEQKFLITFKSVEKSTRLLLLLIGINFDA